MTQEKPPTSIVARVLAPLALVAVLVALIAVLSSGLSDEGKRGDGERRQQVERKANDEPKAATYVVEPGDTVTSISEKTGVSIEAIEQLNPDLDPQTLTSGQEIKLR